MLTAKTKILVFSKGRMTQRRFLYNGQPIENLNHSVI